jgi:ParB/RepB/Spo0J family partition protein
VETEQIVRELPISMVYRNPNQPRTVFEQSSLEELARSIKVVGLMQPITVVPRPSAEGAYLIVAGERRWRASKLAGLSEIPSLIRSDLTDKTVQELALVENLLRKDLGLIEEAKAYQGFLESGYTVESLAELLGFAQSWRITERTNLLKLDPALQDGIAKGGITASQGQEMSRLSSEGQFQLWRAIQDGKCPTYVALRRLANAIYDQEHQVELFKSALNEKEKKSIDKVDQFLSAAGRLISMIDADDLATIEKFAKSNAAACADQLELLEKLCRKTKAALLSNAGKQEALAMSNTQEQ